MLEAAGIERTKMRGDDKEPAFLVKQNSMLKIVLALLVIILVLGIAVCSTVLEVRVQRRGVVQGHTDVRLEQQRGHADTIQRDIKLQELLQEEVEDLEMIADARSTMTSLLAAYMKDVEGAVARQYPIQWGKMEPDSTTVQSSVKGLGELFAKNLKQLINQLFKEAQKESVVAQQTMESLAKDIQKESETEAKEKAEYERYMREAGEEIQEYMRQHHLEQANRDPRDLLDGHHEVDPKVVNQQLNRFWFKLDEAKGLHFPPALAGEWQAFWDAEVAKNLEMLDADMALANRKAYEQKMVQFIAAAHMPAWNPKKYHHVQDYFHALLEGAKTLQHLSFLESLRHDQVTGVKTNLETLAEIEKISYEKGLPLHWLWDGDHKDDQHPSFNEDAQYVAESEAKQHSAPARL